MALLRNMSRVTSLCFIFNNNNIKIVFIQPLFITVQSIVLYWVNISLILSNSVSECPPVVKKAVIELVQFSSVSFIKYIPK